MTFEINSRIYGLQTFTAPEEGGYVRLNGEQICEGGGYLGTSVIAGAGEKNLEREARKWWRARMRRSRQDNPEAHRN